MPGKSIQSLEYAILNAAISVHVTEFDNRLEVAELLIKHISNLNATIYKRSRH